MPDLVSDLRRRIAEAGDAERALQMHSYMKSALPFRRVPTDCSPASRGARR